MQRSVLTNPDALGTSRTIVVDPTLPLANHEIVLTFDDGPSPRYTDRVLAILAAECVKATFFMVGEMAQMFPAEAKTKPFQPALVLGRTGVHLLKWRCCPCCVRTGQS